jgi:phosphate starvation-inducible PhoH-like protein
MKEDTLTLDSRDEAVLLFGSRDQFLREIRQALGVQIIGRGEQVAIKGEDEAVDSAMRLFTQLRSSLRKHGSLDIEMVRAALEVARGHSERVLPLVSEGPTVPSPTAGPLKSVRARTEGQTRYLSALRDKEMVLCAGPAGTGKTWLAVAMAVSLLRSGAVKKIVLVRPAVEAGERLGFLPGDIAAKVNPYLRPLFDALNDLMDPEQVKRYVESDVIEIAPLAYMRGRTLNSACIILDEGQNTTVSQMMMFLTRMGNGSKIIVTGDTSQIDLPPNVESGLIDALERLEGLDGISVVYLDERDIVRHPLVQRVLSAYGQRRPSVPGTAYPPRA